MARISYAKVGYYQLDARIVELNSGANYTLMRITLKNQYGTSLDARTVYKETSTTSNLATFSVSAGASYYLEFYITTGVSEGSGSSSLITMDSPPPPPSTPTNLGATPSTSSSGVMYLSWTAVGNATSYPITVRTSSGTYLFETSSDTNSATISGLAESTSYYFYVAASNAYGTSSYASVYGTTYDFTGPSVSLSLDGAGRVNASWTASDSGVGLRATNRYYVEISNANGTTYGGGLYTVNNNAFHTFTTDGNGYSLVNGSAYYVRVTAYDASNNATATSKQVTYTATRPTNWEWYAVKTQGSNYNLTADEWNAFGRKINEFRLYTNFSAYPFTTVTSGNTVYATQLNEAIDAMNNFTTTPSLRTSGQEATAAFFVSIRDHLNAVQ